MSYRTILVQTEDSTPGRMQLKAAISLAQRFNASLSGVYLKAEQIPAMFIGDAFSAVTLAESFFKEREELIANASARARAMFEAAATQAGVRHGWSEVNGDSEAALILAARRHDLSVLRREVQPVGGAAPILASEVAMASGGPVIILPEAGYKIPFGENILVGWKEGREAARALRDAAPFLGTAQCVTLFSVSHEAPEVLDDFSRAFFEAHGARSTNIAIDRDEDQSAGDAIRRRSGIVGADMLVLGLYGHSRMQELFLGGVSRNMLSDLNLPMLVSH
jgi:nucleotide-binding universal stress UspA family protein